MTGQHKGVRSQVGLDAVASVRGIAAELAEVEEAVDKFGHVSFRVRDKPFVMLGEGDAGPSLSIKCDAHAQQHLIAHRGFVRTPYIGQHGWASLRSLPPPDWDEIAELVVDAYVLVAPKSLSRRMTQPREPRDA